MQTHLSGARRAALTRLIDYAGLFPPAKLEMRPAAAQYAAAKSGPCAWMLGNFIVPLSRLAELREELPAGAVFPLSVILDGGLAMLEDAARAAGDERLPLRALEIRLEPEDFAAFADGRASAGLDAIPAYVEIRRDERWTERLDAALPALRARGLHAKLRCGGLDASAFPSPAEVAAFLERAARARVRFKATAGLHHPIRGLNAESGFTMHGFLNLIAASALAYGGAPADVLERVLRVEEQSAFAFAQDELRVGERSIGTGELQAAREDFFAGYGSCSFEEPLADLRALGMPV